VIASENTGASDLFTDGREGSIEEGLALVQAQAMACGFPCGFGLNRHMRFAIVLFIAPAISTNDVPRFRYLWSTRDLGGALQRDCHKEKDTRGKKDLKSGFRRL
jgi:hypothetical protein